MMLTTKTILPLGALTLALAMPVGAAAQDADAHQEGPGDLRGAEVLDVPFDRWQGREAEPA